MTRNERIERLQQRLSAELGLPKFTEGKRGQRCVQVWGERWGNEAWVRMCLCEVGKLDLNLSTKPGTSAEDWMRAEEKFLAMVRLVLEE